MTSQNVGSGSPIPWVQATIEGEVNTSSEAVQSWLNQNGITDLRHLTKEQLQNLITYLQSLGTVQDPETLTSIVSQLQNLQSNWNSSSNTDPLSTLRSELTHQSTFVSILANATTGNDNLDNAAMNLETQLANVNQIISSLGTSTSAWNAATNLETVGDVEELLQVLADLESQGVDLNALGLGNLRTQLQSALDTYNAAIAAPGGDDKVDLSKFRQAVAQAKVNYYTANGRSTNDPLLVAEQNVVRNETTWQQNLTTPWNATQVPKPGEMTVAGLQTWYSELESQYQMALQTGDGNAQNYLLGKMQLVRQALSSIREGASADEQLAVFVQLFLNLNAFDIAEKRRLQTQAKESGNQALVDQLEGEIQTLLSIAKSVADTYKDVMADYAQKIGDAVSSAGR